MTALTPVFTVRVQMLSDWIVGTGEGRVGDVDATVRRDSSGLPFVPAKTLTGIWRDACEQAAGWLGGPGEDGPWQAWVDWVFGSQPDAPGDRSARAHRAPQPAALSAGAAGGGVGGAAGGGAAPGAADHERDRGEAAAAGQAGPGRAGAAGGRVRAV